MTILMRFQRAKANLKVLQDHLKAHHHLLGLQIETTEQGLEFKSVNLPRWKKIVNHVRNAIFTVLNYSRLNYFFSWDPLKRINDAIAATRKTVEETQMTSAERIQCAVRKHQRQSSQKMKADIEAGIQNLLKSPINTRLEQLVNTVVKYLKEQIENSSGSGRVRVILDYVQWNLTDAFKNSGFRPETISAQITKKMPELISATYQALVLSKSVTHDHVLLSRTVCFYAEMGKRFPSLEGTWTKKTQDIKSACKKMAQDLLSAPIEASLLLKDYVTVFHNRASEIKQTYFEIELSEVINTAQQQALITKALTSIAAFNKNLSYELFEVLIFLEDLYNTLICIPNLLDQKDTVDTLQREVAQLTEIGDKLQRNEQGFQLDFGNSQIPEQRIQIERHLSQIPQLLKMDPIKLDVPMATEEDERVAKELSERDADEAALILAIENGWI